MPILSILTTTYNRENYLKDCIESVLASTFQDWEMIIVDDCSTDHSVEIAQSYAALDNRIKVFVNEINLGDYPNRNRAASYASGKYLKYLDADDMIYPHGLEIMVTTMEKYQEAALGISQEVLEDYLPYPFLLSPHEAYIRQFTKRGVLDMGPTNTIIKRAAFEQLNGFSGTRYIGDSEMWLKLSAIYTIVKIQSGLVFWRRHEGQEFELGHKNNDYTILDYRVKSEALSNSLCPLTQDEIKLAKKRIENRHGRAILRIAFKQLKVGRAIDIMKQTHFNLFKLLKAVLQ